MILENQRQNEFITSEIRNLVKSIYAFQKLRIATGGRVIAVFYGNVGGKATDDRDITALNLQLELNKLIKEDKKNRASEITEEEMDVLKSKANDNANAKYNKFIKPRQTKRAKMLGVKALNIPQLDQLDRDFSEDWAKRIIKEDEAAKQSILDELRSEYSRITDTIVSMGTTVKKYFLAHDASDKIEYFNSESLYQFFSYYNALLETEELMVSNLSKIIERHPLWDAFLRDAKGCGVLMSGVCIAYFDVYKARHCSSFWKYSGLDVVTHVDDETGEVVGEARGKKHAKDNLVDYIDASGETRQKASLGYNPFLRSKLLGVLGGSFLKTKSPYADIYYNRRNYEDNRVGGDNLIPAQKHSRAIRYMVKMFVRDLWVAWRTVEGLEVTEPYEVAKLGMKPHGSDVSVDKAE